jgi:hypothetical protein
MENLSNSHHDYRTLKSITPSAFFGNSPDNIVELENFMTQEEKDYLIAFAKNNNVWDKTESHFDDNGVVIYDSLYWADRVATENSLLASDPHSVKIIRGLMDKLQPIVEEFFSVKVQATGPAVVKWPPGTFQKPHADKELHEDGVAGMPNDFPHYDIASLFYINDDYEGGELYFPLQGIQIKPKSGAAYFFPGDKEYIHGVTEITSGMRYTCPFFWNILEHTGDRKP